MSKQKSSLEEVKTQTETSKSSTNNSSVKVEVLVPRLEYGKKTYKLGEHFELDIATASRLQKRTGLKLNKQDNKKWLNYLNQSIRERYGFHQLELWS